jgi:elongation factor G
LKVYDGTDIRNVGLAGHLNCGKTSFVAGAIYTTGATNRLTRVDEGNTITDFDDEETQRRITIASAVAAVEWKKKKLNLIDTPGFNIFVNDTRQALVAADAMLTVVDGVSGVEVQTEKVWSIADSYELPRALLVNKLDRERADFARALESIQAAFGRGAIPVHLPLGSERDFNGIVDLIAMKAYTYTSDGDGKGTEAEIPAALSEAAKTAHEALVEMIAEGDDALMEEFFDKGTLPVDHIRDGLKRAVREQRIFPVLCAAALHNIGTGAVLDFLHEYFPAPSERPPQKGRLNGNEVERRIADGEPTSVFVFKTVADPFAGRVSYLKVISGVVKNDGHLINRRQAEGHAHRGYTRRQGFLDYLLRRGFAGAVHRLRDPGQNPPG